MVKLVLEVNHSIVFRFVVTTSCYRILLRQALLVHTLQIINGQKLQSFVLRRCFYM